MKTLKDVVRKHSPKLIGDHFGGGVADCPDDYPYLEGHHPVGCYPGHDCEKCWNRPYIEKYSPEKQQLIDSLKWMRDTCSGKYPDCRPCLLRDICTVMQPDDDDSGFIPCDITLPEEYL